MALFKKKAAPAVEEPMDLEAVMKNYGAYMGYWDSENLNYLFADVINLNVESAWLFACCYLQ